MDCPRNMLEKNLGPNFLGAIPKSSKESDDRALLNVPRHRYMEIVLQFGKFYMYKVIGLKMIKHKNECIYVYM